MLIEATLFSKLQEAVQEWTIDTGLSTEEASETYKSGVRLNNGHSKSSVDGFSAEAIGSSFCKKQKFSGGFVVLKQVSRTPNCMSSKETEANKSERHTI